MVLTPRLRHNRRWRLAVWSLRGGYLSLIVALVGLLVEQAGGTPWILFAGVLGWISAAVVTVTGVVGARYELRIPRPWFWSLRFQLIRDSVRRLTR
jgi:hypothetical protein